MRSSKACRFKCWVSQGGLDRFPGWSCSAAAWPLVLPVIGPRADPLPMGTRRQLDADLDLFCELVTAAVGVKVDLELRPTGVTIDNALSAVGRVGRAAVGL